MLCYHPNDCLNEFRYKTLLCINHSNRKNILHWCCVRHKSKGFILLSYRYDAVVLQALSPQLNSLHGSQVRACPVKPLVVPVAPLAIMNQYFFCLVVNLLYVGSIPLKAKRQKSHLGKLCPYVNVMELHYSRLHQNKIQNIHRIIPTIYYRK